MLNPSLVSLDTNQLEADKGDGIGTELALIVFYSGSGIGFF